MKQKTQVNYEMVDCLGWCNKKFPRVENTNYRYCPKCAAKKEDIERRSAGIRTFSPRQSEIAIDFD